MQKRRSLSLSLLVILGLYGCSDANVNDETCHIGERECIGNTMFYCQNGEYVSHFCSNGCNAQIGACINAGARCTVSTCPVGQTCSEITGNCVSGVTEPECSASAPCPAPLICKSGVCVSDNNQPECSDSVPCRAPLICKSGVCVSDNSQPECSDSAPCRAPLTCENGVCVNHEEQPECSDLDAPYCSGNTWVTCQDGKQQFEECQTGFHCEASGCVEDEPPVIDPPNDECDPADYPICDAQGNRLTCVEGQIVSKGCAKGLHCDSGECVEDAPPEPECNEADYPKCEGNARIECVDGATHSITCKSGCDAALGVCNEDKPECDEADYPQCEGDETRLTCESGKIKKTACGKLKMCEAGACIDRPCEPESTTCQSGMLAICDKNQVWQLESCGTGQICLAGECVEHGTAPEVKTCEQPLAISGDQACEKTGAGKKLVLRGDILGFDQTLEGGSIVIEGSKITYVGCDPNMDNATVITCPNSVISPAFINGHEHVTFSNGVPAKWGDERFDHRHDWRKGKNGHNKVPGNTTSANNGNSVVEMRALLSGTTSIFGSGSAPGLARNLDVKSSTIGGITSIYQTFPLNDSDGKTYDSGCNYTYHDSVASFDNSCPYGPHIAEGINQAALNEMRCLSGEGSKSKDIFKPNVAVIHGIAITIDMIKKMADNQVKLIWSPRTNISLYGDTAQAPLYHRMGVTLGLGTDWLYSGSANMLRELQCVDYLNQNHYSRYFSDYELWLMPTWNNAVAFGVEKYLGKLEAGFNADVVIFKKTATKTGYRAVIEANNEDVLLVTMNGTPIYGDANLMVNGSEFSMCGQAKKFDFKATGAKSEITDMSVLEAAAKYPMYFCDTPKDEPTCVPQRTRPTDTETQKTTLYNGDYTAADDADGDGIQDDIDNCPTMFNPIRPMELDRKQTDSDDDGWGDICDPYPMCAANDTTCNDDTPPTEKDTDNDGIKDAEDNCPKNANPDQTDTDGDGKGDACDACPNDANPGDAACPGATAYTVDFSCPNDACEHTGSGYKSEVYTETFGDVTFTAKGDVNTTKIGQESNFFGLSMTGNTSNPSSITVTGIDGLAQLTITYVSYNPTPSTDAILNITAGTHADQIKHSYDATAVQELSQTLTYDDKTITSFTIAPEQGTGNNAHRIHITSVSWTIPE